MATIAGVEPAEETAPEIEAADWLNTPKPLSLKDLRGRVVVVEAFQMLCPGCVQHGLPQAQRIAGAFRPGDLQVIGLHTVFEHHAVQGTREALEVFLHEYRIRFPVAIDRPGEPLPATMAKYGMQGTPTLLLIDRAGRLRAQHLGAVPDLQLGAQIGALLG
ncbi:MAG TPA: redoxin family protein [Burkholderiales bacterium]|nr:redoxin family protein [Burkholderiales bacterium]